MSIFSLAFLGCFTDNGVNWCGGTQKDEEECWTQLLPTTCFIDSWVLSSFLSPHAVQPPLPIYYLAAFAGNLQLLLISPCIECECVVCKVWVPCKVRMFLGSIQSTPEEIRFKRWGLLVPELLSVAKPSQWSRWVEIQNRHCV